MSNPNRRSNWEPAHLTRTRRRPRLLLTSALGGVAAAVLLGGALVGLEATPALALCSHDGDTCVNTASTSPSIAILPVTGATNASLSLRNDDASGTAKVGVVGYLRGDGPTEAAVVDTALKTTASVAVATGGRRTVRLTDVPADARAIMLQVGGGSSPDIRSSWRPTATPSGDSGRTAKLSLSPSHDRVTRARLFAAIRTWAARTASPMPSSSVINGLVDKVGAATGTPAHLAAAIAPAAASLRVAWRLQAGSEDVTAVRITRDGTAAGSSSPLTTDRAPRSGTITLDGLTPGRSYTVTVSPVLGGTTGTPITMQAAPLEADSSTAPSASAPSASAPTATSTSSASSIPTGSTPTAGASSPAASASPTSSPSTGSSSAVPAAPAGYKLLFSQDFSKSAALGSFTKAYPGYSGYDGGLDTSKGAGRPANQVGVWNNDATSSVSDGVYNCHLFTKGAQPQICALTPTPNGQYWGGQMYGRYSVRFKSDKLPGYKIAWLLWPQSDDWNQGEIDFPEGALDDSITGSVHNVRGNPGQNAYFVDTKKPMTDWQTATIDWRPGRVTFILDDQSWTTTDPSGIPTHPMRWALQAETQISSQAPSASVAGDLQIDWLAGYSYTG